MQGDWTSSPRRLSSCSDPRGAVKRARADVIRLSYLLSQRSHPALHLLIRLLQSSQWRIDFPPHYYGCHNPPATLTDGHFLFHFFCRPRCPPRLYMRVKNIIGISFQFGIVMGDGAVFKLFFFSFFLFCFFCEYSVALLRLNWSDDLEIHC